MGEGGLRITTLLKSSGPSPFPQSAQPYDRRRCDTLRIAQIQIKGLLDPHP